MVNEGTVIKLYLPATRALVLEASPILSREDYNGNGEMILVVDDIKEQRDITSAILTTLGYTPATAASGEEAVEYMKTNSADLIILDMIMNPGIDGLDTYKKIIEFKPKQKAIIASGFSETDRVREARKLGARKYIKKPYTIENIGVAIKAELAE